MKTAFSNPKVRFADALLRCREVAEAEYCVADGALGRAEANAGLLRDRVDALIRELPSEPSNEVGMSEVIRKVGEQLSHQVEHLIVGTRRKLTAKRHRLRKFTIALFGRTMAGKSTFREAITGATAHRLAKAGRTRQSACTSMSGEAFTSSTPPALAPTRASSIVKKQSPQ